MAWMCVSDLKGRFHSWRIDISNQPSPVKVNSHDGYLQSTISSQQPRDKNKLEQMFNGLEMRKTTNHLTSKAQHNKTPGLDGEMHSFMAEASEHRLQALPGSKLRNLVTPDLIVKHPQKTVHRFRLGASQSNQRFFLES
jgi:hypothetical protein